MQTKDTSKRHRNGDKQRSAIDECGTHLPPNELLQLYIELPIVGDTSFITKEAVTQTTERVDFSEVWLPLASSSDKRDDGLLFSEYSKRFRQLIEFEIQKDAIPINDKQNQAIEALAKFDGACLLPPTSAKLFQDTEAQIELPQLSNIPPGSPYKPKETETTLDLVSMPASSAEDNADKLRQEATSETISSDMELTEAFFNTAYEPTVDTRSIEKTIQDDKIEVPLISNAVLSPASQDVEMNLTCDLDLQRTPEELGVDFMDEFSRIINTNAEAIRRQTEQELLEFCAGVERQPVPLMDSDIQIPDWEPHCHDGHTQFTWLKKVSAADEFQFPLPSPNCLSTKQLKWIPIPPGMGQVRIDEEPKSFTGVIDKETEILEWSYNFNLLPKLSILEFDDKEIDEDVPGQVDSSEDENDQQPEEEPYEIFQLPAKRNRETISIDESTSMLSNTNNGSVASKLLANFIELHTSKRPRMEVSDQVQPQTSEQSKHTAMSEPSQNNLKLSDLSAAPGFSIPSQKATAFISVNLHHSIFREVQRLWGQDYLIDADYHDVTVHPSRSNLQIPREIVLEADISLSPRAGIIVTTFIEARQTSPPGSETDTALRSRLRKLQHMYENIHVLISHDFAKNDPIEALSASDMKAYTAFVVFTLGLEASFTCHLVPGPLSSTAPWIVALMCESSTQSLQYQDLLSDIPTSWELLLRRCGMNIFAAQVLTQTMYKAQGNEALVEFLTMSTEQRLEKYTDIVGYLALKTVSDVLDRGW